MADSADEDTFPSGVHSGTCDDARHVRTCVRAGQKCTILLFQWPLFADSLLVFSQDQSNVMARLTARDMSHPLRIPPMLPQTTQPLRYEQGNAQTDHLLTTLGLSHRWTQPVASAHFDPCELSVDEESQGDVGGGEGECEGESDPNVIDISDECEDDEEVDERIVYEPPPPLQLPAAATARNDVIDFDSADDSSCLPFAKKCSSE